MFQLCFIQIYAELSNLKLSNSTIFPIKLSNYTYS